MKLYLLRHAKAVGKETSLSDFDRPLAPRGSADSSKMAEYMLKNNIAPELVLCSPSRRTRETLAGIEDVLEHQPTIHFADEIYDASPDELLASIRAVGDSFSSVMVIGHNPGEHELALRLAAGDSKLAELEVKYPTAALAEFKVTGSWKKLGPGSATLSSLTIPKDLR